jgi:hypothetical protein
MDFLFIIPAVRRIILTFNILQQPNFLTYYLIQQTLQAIIHYKNLSTVRLCIESRVYQFMSGHYEIENHDDCTYDLHTKKCPLRESTSNKNVGK